MVSNHYQRFMMNRFSTDIARGMAVVTKCQVRLEENYTKDTIGSAVVAGAM
jgi:hypothetical protein